MINYIKKVESKKKLHKLILDDYYVLTHLFKKEISFNNYIVDLNSKYRDNKDNCIDDYEGQILEDEYYIYLSLLSDLIVISKMQNDFKKTFTMLDVTFNDNKLKIAYLKRYSDIYLIIDNILPICINKHDVICGISLFEDNFYYSFLNRIEESYIGLDKLKDHRNFIELIRSAL